MAKIKKITPYTSVGVTGYNVRVSIEDLYRLAILLNQSNSEVDDDFIQNHPAITSMVRFVGKLCDNTIGNPYSDMEFDTFVEEDKVDNNDVK